MSYEIYPMDCRTAMSLLMAPCSVDSIVTDPPYHLSSIVKRFASPTAAPAKFGTDGAFSRASAGFMGKSWDGGDVAFDPDMWREAWRVLKPGGYLLAFSGSRTYHRMACAIEDAGFEIRDQIMWIYGSGFPKGSVVDGWGTALKPAHEPIVVARKPLLDVNGRSISVAKCVETWGTGAINIDGCRVGDESTRRDTGTSAIWGRTGRTTGGSDSGRFPANIIHDGSDEVLAAFPTTSRGAWNGTRPGDKTNNIYGKFGAIVEPPREASTGSAARFFYCAKASRADRDEGLDHLPVRPAGMLSETSGQHMTRRDEGYEVAPRANTHPTVKPTELMRYLVRMVTPAGGTVLDPFTGSGSTGKAALLEGFSFIGCEMTDEYVPIAEARCAAALAQRAPGSRAD